MVYILGQAAGNQEQHICSIHKLLVKSAFPKYLIKNHPNNHFDTHFDKTQQNQAFHHFSQHQKSPYTTPKILSTPYKIRLQSNSTKNHTQSTKFHLTNNQKFNIKIIQNTSKINTFQLHQTHKQYHSIEVIFFTIKLISNSHQKITLISNPNNKTTIHHTTFLT